MKPSFYEIVDKEIQLALPDDWEKITSEKLLGQGPYKIRHAFNLRPIDGQSKLTHLLALPLSVKLNKTVKSQLIHLRDYILSEDHMLVVINEEKKAGSLGDTGIFIEEQLLVSSRNFLWLRCSRDQYHKTCLDGHKFEDLSLVIRDLWRGALRYQGPEAGTQNVNLELMRKSCSDCNTDIKVVTGIVFPNRQLSSWNNYDWQYYDQLVSLSDLGPEITPIIQKEVDQLREKHPSLTPVGFQYSDETEGIYFASSCPHCKALLGHFDIEDERMAHLFSLDSRINGYLEYYSFSLKVDHELLAALRNGGEACVHTCYSGWER
jgi:hypothetical protein